MSSNLSKKQHLYRNMKELSQTVEEIQANWRKK
jgi:hypothetical protein